MRFGTRKQAYQNLGKNQYTSLSRKEEYLVDETHLERFVLADVPANTDVRVYTGVRAMTAYTDMHGTTSTNAA